MYVGFLKGRATRRLHTIREHPEKRPLYITLLQESYGDWKMEEEKAELHLVATLENPDIPRGDKVTMLWAEPSSKTLQEKLKKWAGLLDTWEPYFRFRRDAPYPPGAGMTGKNLVALMDSMRGDGIK